MGSRRTKRVLVSLTSSATVAVFGPPIRVGIGNTVEVQFIEAPGALAALQVSFDGEDFDAGTDADGAGITNVAEVTRSLRERPEWVRMSVGIDASGPRVFRGIVGIGLES